MAVGDSDRRKSINPQVEVEPPIVCVCGDERSDERGGEWSGGEGGGQRLGLAIGPCPHHHTHPYGRHPVGSMGYWK
jgi:hypothetical protein